MKAGELIECLECFDPELQVLITVQDICKDEIISASVKKVYDTIKEYPLCGRYEELGIGHKFFEKGKGFYAIILYT